MVQGDLFKQELVSIWTSIDQGYQKVHEAVHASNRVLQRFSTDLQGVQTMLLRIREDQGRQHYNSINSLITKLKDCDQKIEQLRTNIRHVRKRLNEQHQYTGDFVGKLQQHYSKDNIH